MPHLRNSPLLSRAALAFCLLSSASFLNACADLPPPVAPQPPQSLRPCELPYQEKADELTAQPDLTQPLSAEDWAKLEASDAGAYNNLYPRYNANIDWAGARCIAKPSDAAPTGK